MPKDPRACACSRPFCRISGWRRRRCTPRRRLRIAPHLHGCWTRTSRCCCQRSARFRRACQRRPPALRAGIQPSVRGRHHQLALLAGRARVALRPCRSAQRAAIRRGRLDGCAPMPCRGAGSKARWPRSRHASRYASVELLQAASRAASCHPASTAIKRIERRAKTRLAAPLVAAEAEPSPGPALVHEIRHGHRTSLPSRPPASRRRCASATPSKPTRSATRGRIAPPASRPNSCSRSSRNQAGWSARIALIE